MNSDSDARLDWGDPTGADALRPVVRAVVATAMVVFVLLLATALPGLDRLVPLTTLSVETLVRALVSLGVAGGLVVLAPRAERLLREALAGPDDAVAGAAAAAKYLLGFVAALVAHRGLAPAATAFLAPVEAVWLYDLGFLALALVPLALVAAHLYRNLNPVTDLLTRTVRGTTRDDRDGRPWRD